MLDYLGWSRWGLSDETWMILILAVVVGLVALVNLSRRDVAYTVVILWALAGIAAKFPNAGIVTTATWVTFALVAVTLVAAYLVKRK